MPNLNFRLHYKESPVLTKVIVTLPLEDAALAPLRERFDVQVWDIAAPETLSACLADADGVLCALNTHFDGALLRANSHLKVISSISVGLDHIDVDAATAAGIRVGHTPGVLVDSTADMALSLMLATSRRVVEADRFIRNGRWTSGWSAGFFLGTDLSRATVGLIGLGPIGQAVAKRLQAFGARVIAWNRTPSIVAGVEMVELDTLFSQADIVSCHVALVPDTQGLVSTARLASMKDGAIVINTARGGVVDEAALIAELQTGRLRAGLDVFEQEPLPIDSPLLGFDNVVLVPHLGSATAATREAMFRLAVGNLIAGMSGAPLPHCANPVINH